MGTDDLVRSVAVAILRCTASVRGVIRTLMPTLPRLYVLYQILSPQPTRSHIESRSLLGAGFRRFQAR